MRRRAGRFRHGIAMVYAIIAMIALCAFVSLAVDLGKVQLAKTELMRAADASARAAAQELANGSNLTTIQNAAGSLALANKCDGTAVSLSTSTDVEFGTWDTSTGSFTLLANSSYTSANAVRVTARRTTATGNPIALAYGRILGLSNCDVKATVISFVSNSPPGFTGLSVFDAHKDLLVASYNSNAGYPSSTSHNNNADIGGNGTIDLGTSGDLYGDQWAGPSATVSTNGLVHGTKHALVQNIATVSIPSMTPVSNPGGVSATPNPNGTSNNWPGGTYYFTSFTMGGSDSVTFTGPATILMNGNATIGDNCAIYPYNYKPANLTWYQASGTKFTAHNDLTMGARFIGPNATLTVNDRAFYGGSIFVNKLYMHDTCEFYWDETMSNSSSAVGSSVQSVR